jgi:TM2 domain-containing membrane protein YozV
MVTYDEYFCRACHKRFTDQNDLDLPANHKAEAYVVQLPKAWVAAILSCLGPGLGQFYNGDTIKGIVFFVGFLFVSFGYYVSSYHTQILVGIWIVALLEALYTSERIAWCKRSYGGVSYLLYAELGLLGLVALLHFLTGEPNIQYMAKLFPVVGLWIG